MMKITNEPGKRLFTKVRLYEKINAFGREVPNIKWSVQIYNYLYVIHKILNHATRNVNGNPGCPLNVQYLAQLFGKSNSETSTIIKNLIKWKLIRRTVKADLIGKHSAKYSIAPEYDNDSIVIFYVSIDDVGFIKKLINNKSNSIKNDKLIHQTFIIQESMLSVNYNGFLYLNNKYSLFNTDEYTLPIHGGGKEDIGFSVSKTALLKLKRNKKIEGGYGIEQRDIPLFLILIGHFRCSRPLDKNQKKSRLYNSLTNLPREHRAYLSFGGKPLMMTDIANSQILLTVPLITNYYKVHSGDGGINMPADIIKFQQWSENGRFYENFSALLTPLPMDSEQRNTLKEFIFRELWFGRVHRYLNNRIKPVFRKHFPTVFKIINAIKSEDYRQFSIKLQRFEANILIDTVTRKLLKKHQVLTIHDAVVCNDEATLEVAEQLIAKALAKYSITPKFKRERIVSPSN